MEEQAKQAVTRNERVLALLAYGVPCPVLAPVVVYLVSKDQSPFGVFHSLQSLYLQLAVLAISLGTFMLTVALATLWPLSLLLLVIWPIAGLLCLIGIAMGLVAGVKAFGGEWYKTPLIGNLVPVKESV